MSDTTHPGTAFSLTGSELTPLRPAPPPKPRVPLLRIGGMARGFKVYFDIESPISLAGPTWGAAVSRPGPADIYRA